MSALNYVIGDATYPQGDGPKAIVHVCNNVGLWGRGFVVAVSKRWSEPEAAYRDWYISGHANLGNIQPVTVGDQLWVINMVAQHGVGRQNGPPIRYYELKECLKQVTRFAKRTGASVHLPRIGCGLAGGRWEIVEQIIKETLIDGGVEVTVYDFDG